MRTVSTPEAVILAMSNKAYHLKLSIKNSGGTWVNYSDYLGHDWVKDVNINDQIDAQVMSMQVNMVLDYNQDVEDLNTYWSISPLINTYIDVEREIKLEVATTGEMIQPQTSDYKLIFQGYIDNYNISGDKILMLTCRDLGKKLLDQQIEEQIVYSDDTGTAVETVMQSILTDNSTGVTLYTPTSPSWGILQYRQDKVRVLNALKALADQIGWSIRYKYDSGTSAFRLTFFEPDRTKVTPDITFDGNYYTKLSTAKVDANRVRNKVRVIYTDSTTGERTTTEASDATSISKYGTRFMEIAESSSSQIDTSTEANKMRDNILADLKDPVVQINFDTPFYWPVELNDLVRIEANDLFTSDQDVAVKSFKHTFSKGTARTSWVLHGKPASGYNNLLQLQMEGGGDFVGPASSVNPKQELTQFSIANGFGAITRAASLPGSLLGNANFEDQSRVVEDSNGNAFPPDNWKNSAGDWGSTGDIYVNTNSQTGNRSLEFRSNSGTGTKTLESADFVPITEDNLYDVGAIVWSNSVDASDNHQIQVVWYQSDKSTVVSTANVLNTRISGSTWTRIPTQTLLAPTNARYAKVKINKVISTDHSFRIDKIEFQRGLDIIKVSNSSGLNLLSNSGFTTMTFNSPANPNPAGSFNDSTNIFTCKYPGIYYISGELKKFLSGAKWEVGEYYEIKVLTTTSQWFCREKPWACYVNASQNYGQTITNNTWTKIDYNNVNTDLGGSDYDTTNDYFVAPTDGVYTFNVHHLLNASSSWSAGELMEIRLLVDNTTGAGNEYRLYVHESPAAGTFYIGGGGTATLLLSANQTVQVEVFQNSGSNINLISSDVHNWLTVQYSSGPVATTGYWATISHGPAYVSTTAFLDVGDTVSLQAKGYWGTGTRSVNYGKLQIQQLTHAS